MTRWEKKLRTTGRWLAAVLLSLTVPALSLANITNTASVTFTDATAASYSLTSNTVTTITPPVINSAATATGNIGVPFVPYTITATNSPTSFGQTGLPAGLQLNSTTGVISGTPSAAGTFTVTLTATNQAGPSAPFTLTITIQGAPVLTLTKSSDKATATTGTTITYTITYQNTGAGDASNVVIKDVIPSGTTLVPASITNGGTVSAGTITWTIGVVAAGAPAQSVSFKVTAN